MQIGKRYIAGFTYLGLLMMIAITGIGMAGVGIVWSQDMQREREKELLFIGDEYRKAIGSYYQSSLGSNKQFPSSLNELVLDKRQPTIKRHIRKLYADPMMYTASIKPWGLILQQGQIIGVHTILDDKPIKKSDFNIGDDAFAEAEKYSDWKFVYAAGATTINVAN